MDGLTVLRCQRIRFDFHLRVVELATAKEWIKGLGSLLASGRTGYWGMSHKVGRRLRLVGQYLFSLTLE